MYDIERNKKIATDFMNAFSEGDIDRWLDMIAEDASYEIMGNSFMSRQYTKSEVGDATRLLGSIFPGGIQINVKALTAEGDRVAMEATGSAISKKGDKYNNTYHFLFVIKDGKIKEAREYLCTKLVEDVLAPCI